MIFFDPSTEDSCTGPRRKVPSAGFLGSYCFISIMLAANVTIAI